MPRCVDRHLWQTDFTYFRIVGWGWYFLYTILDDFSRYNICWRLTTTMASSDVTDTLTEKQPKDFFLLLTLIIIFFKNLR